MRLYAVLAIVFLVYLAAGAYMAWWLPWDFTMGVILGAPLWGVVTFVVVAVALAADERFPR